MSNLPGANGNGINPNIKFIISGILEAAKDIKISLRLMKYLLPLVWGKFSDILVLMEQEKQQP